MLSSLFTLMNFPQRIDKISVDFSILYFERPQIKFLNFDILLSLKIVFILAKNANPDKKNRFN